MKIEVYNKGGLTGDQLEGTLTIDLRTLEHQQKKDEWYPLELDGTSSGNGNVRLRTHYIYSKYKYFSENFNKTELQIMKLDEDIQELNKYSLLFEKPYGIILAGEIYSIIDKKILEKSEDIVDYISSTRKSVYISPRDRRNMNMAQKMENIFRATFSIFLFN